MGLAYSQLCGTMQAHVEGSIALPLQVAASARSAVTSIQLAKAGFAGPHDIFDGPFGYFALYEPNAEPEGVFEQLGKIWRVNEMSIKPFPTGRAAHGTLDALNRLIREKPFGLEDLERLEAHVPPLVKRLVDRPARSGMSVNYARLCLAYLVPVMLREGRLDTASFSEALLNDREILTRASDVLIVDDGNPDPNALAPQRILVTLRDGSHHEVAVTHTLGSPDNPLSPAQQQEKFDHCLDVAGIDRAQRARLCDCLEDLEALASVADMIRLTASPTAC